MGRFVQHVAHDRQNNGSLRHAGHVHSMHVSVVRNYVWNVYPTIAQQSLRTCPERNVIAATTNASGPKGATRKIEGMINIDVGRKLMKHDNPRRHQDVDFPRAQFSHA